MHTEIEIHRESKKNKQIKKQQRQNSRDRAKTIQKICKLKF